MTAMSMTSADEIDPIGFGSDDPYPHYAELREAAPVHRLPDGTYAITRWEECWSTYRNPTVFSSSGTRGGDYASTKSIISLDPPAHTRMRQLVTGPFRPAAIAALEPELRQITEGLVDDLVAANQAGEADLVAHLAVPLPVIAIARMLGIPSERYPEFRHWSDHSVADLAGLDVDRATVKQARRDMMQFFLGLVTKRRRSPGDDLISAIVSGPEPLDDEFAVAFCFTLLVAGNETTTNLIGNAMLALLAHPGQAEKLWGDPGLVPTAVEEALRFDPPAQSNIRRATVDTVVAGHDIPAESLVVLLIGSANRDPRKFPDPDRFDITRNPREHLSFGNGVHLCLGASLARLEARLAYETLIARVRNIRGAGPVARQNGQLRGVRQLPITFEAILSS
jgi:cytochrome P450